MTAPGLVTVEANQAGLATAVAEVRAALERHAGIPATGSLDDGSRTVDPAAEGQAGALDGVCHAFSLSEFERAVLVMCAGVELDGSLGAVCAAAQGDDRRPYPTFGLALAALPHAHWSALSPAAALRRWRLVELTDASSPTASPLRIDEYVLHLLAGASAPDSRLTGIGRPGVAEHSLPSSLAARAEAVSAVWRTRGPDRPAPCLTGPDRDAREGVAARAAASLGLGLLVVDARTLRTDAGELDLVARLLERSCLLEGRALLVEVADGDEEHAGPAASFLADAVDVPLALSGRDRRPGRRRQTTPVEVGRPTAAEQRALWRDALAAGPDDASAPSLPELDRLVGAFDLDPAVITAAARVATTSRGGTSLWEACRQAARPQMDTLAQRIDPAVAWDDMVLPAAQVATLAEMATQVRHRMTVYDAWGMRQSGRGLATTALFAGPSGTGKTMAAEVLAADLGLDLYRVDLSSVVSKYIGETEKNLRRLFDAAEDGAAVLLFDEADALFGRRTEVKDSHDRYANVEVSYLLQRMEQYRGLALLTTNFKEALDPAFMRRIRFVVDFPFPDVAAREAIWLRAFPATAPTDDLDAAQLARLNLTGGGIRSVAVNAAFRAAADGGVIRMAHVRLAARAELAKLGLPAEDLQPAVAP